MEKIEKFLDQYTHFRVVRLRDDIWRDLMGKASEAMKKELYEARRPRHYQMIVDKYSWIGKEHFNYMLTTHFYKESRRR